MHFYVNKRFFITKKTKISFFSTKLLGFLFLFRTFAVNLLLTKALTGERNTPMKKMEEWYEEEFDLDNMYNMDADENYANTDTSIWYN